jgi:hypothetical protein
MSYAAAIHRLRWAHTGHPRSSALATPNYSFEKRQRELAKKRKAEEKRQKKLTRPADSPGDAEAQGEEQPATPDAPSRPTGS